MKATRILKMILTWFPSLIMTLFFVPKAVDKILNSNQTNKVVDNSTIIISTGIFLLFATSMFLYNKTILLGTSFLALYMTFVVFIHRYKGKPYEVAILIVLATIFASYIRKPHLFYKKQEL